jgi:hypothetical protein
MARVFASLLTPKRKRKQKKTKGKKTKGHAQRYASLANRMLVLSSFLEPQKN